MALSVASCSARFSSSCCSYSTCSASSRRVLASVFFGQRLNSSGHGIFRDVRAARMRFQIRAARTEARKLQLATPAPHFQLIEPLTGKEWSLDEFKQAPVLLVMFICNHCPFVIHLKDGIVKLTNEYIPKGLGVVAISSNSVVTHPQDGPKPMAEEAKNYGYQFPYLYDETQEVAKAFGAVCTPDFFLFRKNEGRRFELVYHGQFDDSRPGNGKAVTGRDLKMAIDSVLAGNPVTPLQKPSMGCSIKWHP